MADPPDARPPVPDAFEIPDLDLGAPARPAPPGDAAPAPDPFGALEINDVPTSGGALDLENLPDVPLSGGAAPDTSLDYFGAGSFDADDFDHAPGMALDLADVPAGGMANAPPAADRWPSGSSPERGAIAIDATELELVAGYGRPPSAIHLAPQYAFRVASRQRALRAELVRVETELSGAERSRDRLLGSMVQTLAPALEADERMRSVLEPVRQHDAVARERGAALASTDAEYRRQVGELDLERAGIQKQAGAQQAVVEDHRLEHQRRDEAFRRVEARLKRSHIELRNAQQAAAQAVESAGAGSPIPPEHATRIREIQAQAAAIEPELEQLRGERDAAAARLAEANKQLSGVERALWGVDGRRRTLDQQFGKQLDAQSEDVQKAELEREKALGDAGRAVLAARGSIAIEPATLQAIRDADAAVERLARESEKRLRALDAHDRDAVRRGYTVVAVLALAVVLLVVLVILL